jgi:N-acetylglucosaminyl-diphospho-decaprenol L-rhamnosyltransferase
MSIQNSVVIVNYRNGPCLRRLLSNLKLEESTASEVIVVENPSPDDSADMVRQEFPRVRLLACEYNKGFAAAANRGIREAVGDVVILCHSDIVTSIHVLAELADRVREGAGRRVVGVLPRLVDAANSEQPFVGRLPALARALVGVFKPAAALPCEVPALDHVADHEWARFACVALSAEFIAGAGSLDERFFLYYADADLCQRIHERSYRLLIAPDLKVLHTGRSPNEEPPPHLGNILRKDQQRFFEKHRPAWQQGVLELDARLYRWIKKEPAPDPTR